MACAKAYDSSLIVVAYEGGLVQVHNLYSGTIQFNKHSKSGRMFLQEEVH